MSGPPKTPTQIRRAKGNPGKRPYNKREPKLPAGTPPMPAGLDEIGAQARPAEPNNPLLGDP